MARYSCVYDSAGKLIEIGAIGLEDKHWGSPEAMKKFTVKEVELTTEQAGALTLISQGQGGDGVEKTGAKLFLEAISADEVLREAIIADAIAEVTKVPVVKVAVK